MLNTAPLACEILLYHPISVDVMWLCVEQILCKRFEMCLYISVLVLGLSNSINSAIHRDSKSLSLSQ